jgi:hypothetical protein
MAASPKHKQKVGESLRLVTLEVFGVVRPRFC